jgi:hypothetical protein
VLDLVPEARHGFTDCAGTEGPLSQQSVDSEALGGENEMWISGSGDPFTQGTQNL